MIDQLNRSGIQRLLIHEMAAFSRKLRVQFDIAVRQKGLTLPRARVLFALSVRQGMTQSELAAELDIETPTLVRLLDSMAESGLVERRAMEGDRRVKQIYMTSDGERLADEMNLFADEFRSELTVGLNDDELKVAQTVVHHLFARLLAMGAGAGGESE